MVTQTPSREYREMIDRCARAAGDSGKGVAVFGAAKAGWYIMKALEARSVRIDCFCDNDARKGNDGFHGHRVLSAADLEKEYPGAVVLFGIFRRNSAQAVKTGFGDRGFAIPEHDAYGFLYGYLTEVAGRKCDHELLAANLNKLSDYYSLDGYRYGDVGHGEFVSPFVTGVVTQKCNLRCYDCGQRIPYYSAPLDFSVAEIVRDIKHYCSAFTLVPEISLHGGEPFLHPEIGAICREISSIPNLIFINLITNGNISPADEILRDLASAGADLHQSDYGKLSKQQAEIFSACAKHNIFCDIHFVDPSEKWLRSAPIKLHERPSTATEQIFSECMATKVCCQIMDGRLYRCPVSAHGMAQGLIPSSEGDFVRLGDDIDADTLRRSVRNFLTREAAFASCSYCDPNTVTLVEPAIQLSAKIKRRLKEGTQP